MTIDTSLNSSDVSRVSLVLVAKEPIPGHVKTRLASKLSAPTAAYVHESLLQHMRRTCEQLAAQSKDIDLVLLFDPPDSPVAWNDWNIWRRMPQADGDLGRRLECARNALANRCCDGYVFIGADAPELTGDHLAWAMDEVRQSRYAMIPAYDGGYVLIGIPSPNDSLFGGISWSTSLVADQTRQAAAKCGLVISELPALHDIDTHQDIIALLDRLVTDNTASAIALHRQLTGIIATSR
ncbi:MAG: TIGR04282 family arsenosugar biosynthesis glycosyltransferase [Planctomycetia bacterium]|jgi:rSAM/selenodomain-associated transferase 1|nr:TIGR04282 family arsenosugar biosynthesis glycosyltransferase [Planctomycetia bacterium]